jgi:hypothetical protein
VHLVFELMNKKLLQKYVAQQAMGRAAASSPRQANTPDAYEQFSASQLYCAKCKRAMPVRQKLLLTLPRGDLFDYLCTGCGTSLGTKTANE